MEYLLLSLLIVIVIVSYLNHRSHKRDKSRAETQHQDVKEGGHPKAIFHDLYVRKKSGAMFEHFPVENMAYVRLIMMPLLKVQELLIVAILSILYWMRF